MGTCGWSYPDWVGPFYPRGTQAGAMLGLYARVFDTVEVNATYYAIPPRARVEGWADAVPEDFRFTLKAPQALTHEARLDLAAAREVVDRFLHAVAPLGECLDTVLLQLPPSLTFESAREDLTALLEAAPFPVPLALEARHASWSDDDAFALLRAHRVTWVWSDNPHVDTPRELTTDRAYVRLIGDRELTTFDRVQRDVAPSLGRWWERLFARKDDLSEAKVFANNHYAGFGPGTLNAFLKAAGEDPRQWAGLGGPGVQTGLDQF